MVESRCSFPVTFMLSPRSRSSPRERTNSCLGPPEKEELFQISTPSGAGKIVRAYVDASEKCTALVAAITKDGKLANGWRPQLSEVPSDFEEILLPKAPVKWDWNAASAPFDFY